MGLVVDDLSIDDPKDSSFLLSLWPKRLYVVASNICLLLTVCCFKGSSIIQNQLHKSILDCLNNRGNNISILGGVFESKAWDEEQSFTARWRSNLGILPGIAGAH